MSREDLPPPTPNAPAPDFLPSVDAQLLENEDCAAGRGRRAVANGETCCLVAPAAQVDVVLQARQPLITNPAGVAAAAAGDDRLLRLPASRARERTPPRPRGTKVAVAAAAAAAAVTGGDIPAAAVDEAAVATPASQMLRIAVVQ